MARLPISVETRRRLSEDDRRWPIKLVLRALAIPCALIAMILFAVTTGLSKKNYGGNDWTDGLPLAPVSWMSRLFYSPSLWHRIVPESLSHAPLETWMSFHNIPSSITNVMTLFDRLHDPGIVRSYSPSCTTLSSSSSLCTSAMAAPSTLDGMSESISSFGALLYLLSSSPSVMAGSGTGSPFFSNSKASCPATLSGITGVRLVIR